MQQSGDVLSGPILLTEKVSTTYVMPGWQARLDKLGNIQLRQE
jgi:N-methylhydantoinase A/oxoprolinase/acetone carboxylase beta subunit